MARPTSAQICIGTLAVVLVTVAALAFTGTDSVPAISVLVVGVLLLATTATALAIGRPRRAAAPRPPGGASEGTAPEAAPGRRRRAGRTSRAGAGCPASGPAATGARRWSRRPHATEPAPSRHGAGQGVRRGLRRC